MKKQIRLVFSIFIAFTLIITSCVGTDVEPDTTDTTSSTDDDSSTEDKNLHEAASDYVWDASSVISITLSGTSATISGKGATASKGVITVGSAGNYSFKGTLTEGQIIVDTKDDSPVRIILNGADITTAKSSPIYIKNAKKVIVVLADNTSNKLTDGPTYTYDNTTEQEPNATIFSKEDLTIYGNGSLAINANFQDGIGSKDGLVIKSGNITVNAADDAIRGKDYLVIQGGTLNLTSKADALKASDENDATLGYLTVNNGTITISAGDDALHGESALTINGGTINITKSYEGLEAKIITINDGFIYVTSSDDGVNAADGTDAMGANASLQFNVNGGYLVVNAGGDGLDSNGNITMTAGTVIVHGPTANNNGPLDYNGTFKITGGYLVSVGSSGMLQGPGTSSTQNSIIAAFTAQTAGTLVRIQDDAGKELITFKPQKAYQSLVVSSAAVVKGNYELYVGGNSTGTNKDGIMKEGTYTAGTKVTTFAVSSVVTKVGNVR